MTDDTQLDARIHDAAPREDATACVATPEFDLGRLLGLAAGRADAEAEAHLAACAFCRAMAVDAAEPAGELLVARMGRAWGGTRRVVWGGLAAGLAIAAAAVLFIVAGPRTSEIAPYAVEGPLGGVAAARSSDDAGSNVFVPDSQVRLVLRPTGAPAPAAAAFVSEPGAPLRRLPDAALRREPNGTLLLKGSGRELFGDSAGRKRLYVVVAEAPAALADIAGRTADDARRGAARWHEVEIEYRPAP